MKKQLKTAVFSLFFFSLFIAALWCGVTYRQEIFAILTDPKARQLFIEQIRQAGWAGLVFFFLLKILQVLVVVIPGEPFEIMAGVLYGTFGGLLLSLAGVLCGSVIIYFTMKMLGVHAIDPEKLHKYRFLRDEKRIHIMLFLLFFIPGTPKDILTYMGPFLPIPTSHFFAVSLLARIPSIITSTFAGANIARENWIATVLVFAVTGAVGILCILYNQAIEQWVARLRRPKGE